MWKPMLYPMEKNRAQWLVVDSNGDALNREGFDTRAEAEELATEMNNFPENFRILCELCNLIKEALPNDKTPEMNWCDCED